MVARPGRKQSVFNAGEIGPALDSRSESKYYNAGVAWAENIELIPQGGFTNAPGLRHVGDTAITTQRLVPFNANNGGIYDLAFNDSLIEVWGKTAKLHEFAHPYTATQVREFLYDQQLDTLLTAHKDVAPWRALHASSTSWATGDAPLTELPNYDYGATYTNGIAARWELDFIGFDVGTPAVGKIVYAVKINNEETVGLRAIAKTSPTTDPDMAAMATALQAAILALPNIAAGVTVTAIATTDPFRMRIEFGGIGNQGDGFVVSARVVNKTDAAVLSNRVRAGVAGGEPVISATRGWPRCIRFYQQRLLLGGMRSLRGAWMYSGSGNYYNFDTRVQTADGAGVVVMDVAGGETVENIVDNKFLLIHSSEKNYWIAGSSNGLSKTTPPKHVPAGEHGVAAHVVAVDNEGANLYITKSGDFLGEMRYTDVEGNYVAQDLSLLAYHMIENATDLCVKRKQDTQSANVAAIRNGDGSLRLVYLLREQELTGFVRRATGGTFKAVAVNARNEMTAILERSRGVETYRTLERFEPGLLLDGAIKITLPGPASTITGLGIHEGCDVWAIADRDVLGPFCVRNGQISLPATSCKTLTVGRWSPPRVTTLPLPRLVGPDIWLQKKARIHSVQVMVEDTTSLAIEVNGKIFDQPLRRMGTANDVGELDAGYTGLVTARGFGGYSDAPQVTITQVRPGRMTVKSIVLEATI